MSVEANEGGDREISSLLPRLSRQEVDELNAVLGLETYYADFGGSYSIKTVGPLIASNISYADLDYVADGGAQHGHLNVLPRANPMAKNIC